MILLQAAMGLGIILILIAALLIFVILPVLFGFFYLKLRDGRKEKTPNLSISHYIIITLQAALCSILIVCLISLLIYWIINKYFDPINN